MTSLFLHLVPCLWTIASAIPQGRTVGCEKAVREGLGWLARHQNEDGSWNPASLASRCPADATCGGSTSASVKGHEAGSTGLCLLAFLGAGFGPSSRADLFDAVQEKRRRSGEIVHRGLEWLLRAQHPDGSYSSGTSVGFDDALALAAMSEACVHSKDARWLASARKSTRFLLEKQSANPSKTGRWGWRSAVAEGSPRSLVLDSDAALTSWCVLALDSARRAGIEVDGATMDGVLSFSRASMPAEDPAERPAIQAALGMWLRIHAGSDLQDPALERSADAILKDPPSPQGASSSLEAFDRLFSSQALHAFDGPDSASRSGKFWPRWSQALGDALIATQDSRPDACGRGGWATTKKAPTSDDLGPLFDTAVDVLTLETFYSYVDVPGGSGGPRPPSDVGDTAPEIDAKNGDPSPFKLSDFQGEVVLVDFWNPAFDLGPDLERRAQLADRLRGRPFRILGVGLDLLNDGRYAKVARDHASNWSRVREQTMLDPIHRSYRVLGTPTTVVVDAVGTIRGRNLSWTETVALVDRLVDDVERPQKK